MGTAWLTIAALLVVCQASPVPTKLKYDQSQQGTWNVRADLDNFIILVIPSSSTAAAASDSLMNFLSKTIPLPSYKKSKKHLKAQSQEEENLPDTEQFIESKTAPYHVDISRTRSHLAKLHPEVSIPENIKEDIIIARSPSVALSKAQEIPFTHPEGDELHRLKASRAILITVPVENEHIQRHGIKEVIGGKAGEDIKKSVGLSIEAIEKGLLLAEQQQKPGNEIPPVEVINVEADNSKNYLAIKLKEIEEEVRTNETVNKAVVMAKVIQAGLVEYFRKLAEKLKEKNDAEQYSAMHDEDDDPPKIPLKIHKPAMTPKEKNSMGESSKLQQNFNEKFEKIAEKLREKEVKVKNPLPSMPKVELEPPKMTEGQDKKNNKKNMEKPAKEPNDGNKGHKDELQLLGAENEQCGPGRERDSMGVCVDS